MKAADKRRRNSNFAAEAMEVTMDDRLDEARGHELAILRLLSAPPASPGQFASYLDTIVKSLAPLGRLEGPHLSIGLRAMGTACECIEDASLFRLVARALINDGGLDIRSHSQGVDGPLNTAITHLNVGAVRYLLGVTGSLHDDRGIPEAMSLVCRIIGELRPGAQDDRPIEIMKLMLAQFAQMEPALVQSKAGAALNQLCATTDASESGDPYEVVGLLLKTGFSANVFDEETGLGPLHHAAEKNHWRTAIQLVRFGADIEAKDHEGKTPFDHAEQSGFVSNEIRAIFRSAKMNNIISQKSLAKV
jgi:Ankyrin repeats (many copies)